MRQLPTGTVTLLFTDIEGSTRLLQELGRKHYVEALTIHRELLREAFTRHGGVEVEMQGDSFHFSFRTAREAVLAAAAGQRALADYAWPTESIRVRIGLHTGEPTIADNLYAGLDVHRAARVMSAGHGGQVLLTQATKELAGEGVPLRDLGEHRLKDLQELERLYQLGEEEFPPLHTLDRSNLPFAPSPLIGRARELAEVLALVRGPYRLLTLTGPGGTGKTRFALEAAAELVADFADGVVFVPLALVSEPELVVPAIAQTLGLRQQPGEPISQTVATYLEAKELLLFLDNLEQVVEVAPELGRLIAGCARLRLLATSREPLHLAGEQEYPLPPLGDEEGVALFVERAEASTPAFTLDGSAETVAEICRRLDNLPLAIELAAARVKLFPPEKLLARLDECLRALSGSGRDRPERQRTLRATIEWSYDLLPSEEQRLFRRLAVFPGGCTVEAAESVCEADLDTVFSLVDKNLLRQTGGTDGEPRFRMLETIRGYAAELLADDPAGDLLLRRQAKHGLALAERAEPELRSAGQGRWLETLEAEHDNLRSALSWTLERGQLVTAFRLVGALFWFWELHGHAREGRRWASAAIDLGSGESAPLVARAYATAGGLAWNEGDYAESARMLERALAAFREEGDLRRVAMTLADLAFSLGSLGVGRLSEALAAAEEAVRLARDAGDSWCTAFALLARSQMQEEEDGAIADCEEAVRLYERVGDEYMAGRVRVALGWFSLLEGDYERAEGLSRSHASLAETLGDRTSAATAENNAALAVLLKGEIDSAARLLAQNLPGLQALGLKRVMAEALYGLAGAAGAHGQVARAGVLLGAAEAAIEETETAPTPVELRIVAQLLPQCGSKSFEAARCDGRKLALPDAVAYALVSDRRKPAASSRA